MKNGHNYNQGNAMMSETGFKIEELLTATRGRLINGTSKQVINNISTDSRAIKKGDLFIALQGPNFDGHNFIKDCIEKGAVGAVVKMGVKIGTLPIFSHIVTPIKNGKCPYFLIEVADTLKALGDIANFHRKRFNIPVIGITGSNGKTTTKDMTAHILSAKYNVLKSEGTFNNLIGVPFTLLKLNSGHQACVLEMGTNHIGEIARLTAIARPNIGIITNVGPSHLEFFNNLENVAKAKIELFENFKISDTAVWNADDANLKILYELLSCKKKTFGYEVDCDLRATNAEYLDDGWRFAINSNRLIKIKLLGRYNIYNALAAICAAELLGLEYESIASSLLNFCAPAMRMQIMQAAGVTIINDSYNSNPKSMDSAIGVLSNFNTKGRKILVSGDMLELGEQADYFHRQIGTAVANAKIDIFIAVGPKSKLALDSAVKSGKVSNSVWHCADSQEAGRLLLKIVKPNDAVLIKGSRGMKMEKACSTICSIR